MKQLKESKTVTIKRSQINLNPINPKRHSADRIKQQKKNLQQVGFLGGIVWNEASGNVIDGHRRILAMDSYYKYDGTAATDYDVKVEATRLDDAMEKQQLTYMAVGNTKADIDLIANYAAEIDLNNVGLDPSEIKDIVAINSIPGSDVESISLVDMAGIKPTVKEDDTDAGMTYEEKKQHMKDVKQMVRDIADARQDTEEAFITLSFSSSESKEDFCDLVGVSGNSRFVKGETVLKLIQ